MYRLSMVEYYQLVLRAESVLLIVDLILVLLQDYLRANFVQVKVHQLSLCEEWRTRSLIA